MQSRSGGDSVATGIKKNLPLPLPPYPLSLAVVSLMVSVDVKHHVYLFKVDTQFYTIVPTTTNDSKNESVRWYLMTW